MKSDWLPVVALVIAVAAIFLLTPTGFLGFWLFPALMLALLLIDLVSGKALNPMQGFRPVVVSRDTMPGHFWGSIALLCVLFAFSSWIALARP